LNLVGRRWRLGGGEGPVASGTMASLSSPMIGRVSTGAVAINVNSRWASGEANS
jgi:hypothetical protein